MKKIELGNKVRDAVTGFVGIATARLEFLNGCKQITITGPAMKDGDIRTIDVDEEQVKYVSLGVAKRKAPRKKKESGGPSRYRIATKKATKS